MSMRKNTNLTPKQKQILDFVTSFYETHGYAPSLAEIARHFKKSVPTIHQYIEVLHRKGFLNKDKHLWRSITPQSNNTKVFLLGYIAAGKPIEPIENPEPIEVPAHIKLDKRNSYYALEVKGDSMMDMGILDNDIVLIRHQMTADNGDVIVGITEKGATLKVFKKRNGAVFLEPSNKNYPIIKPKELEIRGKLVGLIRNNL